jgi:cob(I)alamin adenosyltransferase
MAIYTKTGDKGKTSLFEPTVGKQNRVLKSSLRIEAVGSIDEANSYLGVANVYCKNKQTILFIKQIQRELFQIGASLSMAPCEISDDSVFRLEQKIDSFEEKLQPLRNFIMPEGSESAVHFMYARSLVRKAERRIVALSKKEEISDVVLKYVNRLSDYLFMVFRDENRRAKMQEEIWVGKKT